MHVNRFEYKQSYTCQDCCTRWMLFLKLTGWWHISITNWRNVPYTDPKFQLTVWLAAIVFGVACLCLTLIISSCLRLIALIISAVCYLCLEKGGCDIFVFVCDHLPIISIVKFYSIYASRWSNFYLTMLCHLSEEIRETILLLTTPRQSHIDWKTFHRVTLWPHRTNIRGFF